MNTSTFDDELVQEYLAESREHLANIEADLLTIEQNGAAIDEQLVNRVFRAAHSIKGGAGFFDFVKIRELSHRAESILDMVRCRQMVPTSEVVSVLLLSFDKLREMLASYAQSNDADIASFVEALIGLTTAHLSADQQKSQSDRVVLPVPHASRLIQIEAFDLNQARRGGRSIYLIEYDLIHDVQRKDKTPLGILKGLMGYGTILETGFDLDSAGTLDDEPSNRLMLEVLYTTPLESDLINQLLALPAGQIRLIEKNGSTKPLGQSPDISSLAAALTTEEAELQSKDTAPRATPTITQPAPAAAPPAAVRPAPSGSGATEASAKAGPQATGETTIRLNVELLDSLMTLAGELVLSRNQLNEAVANRDEREILAGSQRLSQVTSDLQSTVALTRMQPVGSLFSKFPRLVRDLGRDLGKQVQLKLEGEDVEIDKTILEGLSDPLTHMIRNSVDHGIEEPATRVANGKPPSGTVRLRASHQGGQVIIEISDDGKGLAADKIAASSLAKGMITRERLDTMSDRDKMALIFLPGVSTAEKLSSVSGRGVGMDVVKTNLDKLGGKIEIDSTVGKGSTFQIKLPLTLAIIPSLLLTDCGQKYALPQVSVRELIRIPAGKLRERIDRAADADVLLLRDGLVPLVYLSEAQGRASCRGLDRPMNIILVDTGAFEYGLVVEALHENIEIVVRPLGRHLQDIPDYAGATVLGNGQVAIILDVGGLAARAGITGGAARPTTTGQLPAETETDLHSLLLFHNAPDEPCAVPIELVTRVERVEPSRVEHIGGRKTMQYGEASLPLISLSDFANVGQLTDSQQWVVIVFERAGRPLGILAAEPMDMIEARVVLDAVTLRQPGIAGSAILSSRTTLMIDIFELAENTRRLSQEPSQHQAEAQRAQEVHAPAKILIVEDSDFFRGQIQRLVEGAGYSVFAAANGKDAWDVLTRHADEVSLVATDLEMPVLDGLGLTRLIRSDTRFSTLPIIALSSLAGDEEIAAALAVGISEYQVKLDQDEFLAGIRRALAQT